MKRSASFTRRESQIPVRTRQRSSSADNERVSTVRPNLGRSMVTASPGPACRSSRTFPSPGKSPNFRDSTRVDSRPLQDKSYQNVMCTQIDNFFKSISKFDLVLRNSKNITLSVTQFVEMNSILFALLHMNYNLTGANYIEELPKIAEQLKYKGTIKPSWLKTPSLPNALPHSLGWLSFLVAIANIKSQLSEKYCTLDTVPFTGETNLKQETKRALLQMGISCYRNFNTTNSKESCNSTSSYDNDENIHECFEQIQMSLDLHDQGIQAIDKKLAEREKTWESHRNENKNFTEQNKRLKEQLQKLQDKRDQKFRSVNEKKSEERQLLITMMEKSEGIKTLEKKREEKKARKNGLRGAIKNQEMSSEERDVILQRCLEVQKESKQQDKNIEVVQAETLSFDLQLTKVNASLEKGIALYNDVVAKNYYSSTGQTLEDLQLPVSHLTNPQTLKNVREKHQLQKDSHKDLRAMVEATNNSLKNSETDSQELKRASEKAEEIRDALRLNLEDSKQKMKEGDEDLKKQIAFLENSIENRKKDFEDWKNCLPNVKAAKVRLSEAREKCEEARERKELYIERAEKTQEKVMTFFKKKMEELYEVRLKVREFTEDTSKKLKLLDE